MSHYLSLAFIFRRRRQVYLSQKDTESRSQKTLNLGAKKTLNLGAKNIESRSLKH